MKKVLRRPKRVYTAAVVALVGFFALSAVGNTGTAAQKARSSVGWIGSIGWALFQITIVVTVLYSLALLVVTLRARRRARADVGLVRQEV